ncbi:MAG: hypothetical protein IT247_00120, partial [Bacteroidia bacterium]|nr:hypothetical protein [Bacteroidia bacterium]
MRLTWRSAFFKILSLFIVIGAQAQQPAHFMLGEEQFRGIQIYDVIQDKELNYWFATNEGLYRYDYYLYEKVECVQSKSTSVFNFVMDKNGAIYCHNLNNQIFQITQHKCRLLYELAGDEGKADISLSISDNNELVIGAGKVIVLDEKGKVRSRFNVNAHYLGPAFTTGNGEIQFHLNGSDSVLTYSKGNFTRQELHLTSGKLQNSAVLKFFRIKDQYYTLDLKSKTLFSYHPDMHTLTPVQANTLFDRGGAIRIYEAGSEIWVAGTLPGVVFFTGVEPESGNNFYYEDYFISDVYKDAEGNYLLSTFDKGVLVIPDLKVPDVINSFRDDPVTALYADEATELILGTSKGKLLKYANGKINVISTSGKRPIEALYGSTESNLIVFDDGQIRTYNKLNGKIAPIFEASLKHVAFINGHEFFLGTNYGIVKVNWEGNNTFIRQQVKGVNARVYSLVYEPTSQNLYASTAQGLFRLSPTGESEKIIYQNAPVFSENLYGYKENLFAVTGAHGILVIKNNRVIQTIHPLVNGKTEKLKRLMVYNQTIIAASSQGLFQFDLNGKLLRLLHASSGFTSKKVINFTIHADELWVSHAGGVQKINLNYRQPRSQHPVVRFDRIYVNDEKTG